MAWPTIPDHGGHTLHPVRIVSVMAEDEPFASELTDLGDAIAAGTWFTSFASEYGVQGTPTHVVIKGAHVAAGTSFTQAKMNEYIAATIAAASPSPSPDGRTVYVLYLPPGTMMTVNGVADSGCVRLPYHTAYGTLGDGMAAMNRCQNAYPSLLDKLTTVAAHEIAEAATDSSPTANPAWEMWVTQATHPWLSNIWNGVEGGRSAEIGDLCRYTRVVENGLSVQRIFSNAAAQNGGDPCVPVLAVPYFNVTPDPATRGWLQVSAGASIDVALTGWSTAPTSDWLVEAAAGESSTGTLGSAMGGCVPRTIGGRTYCTSNNGAPLTLHVTIPAGAASGWWGIVELWSRHLDAAGGYVVGEDFGHEAVVGFHVP
jgi:hypothetical protein